VTTPDATVVVVLFQTAELDLTSIPADWPVVLVHNDDDLAPSTVNRPDVQHVMGQGNVGFGAGVNLALPLVSTERVIVCNPDVDLAPDHWAALAPAPSTEVRTVPLIDDDDIATSIINRYPTPFGHFLSGARAGRLAPRGSRRRFLLSYLAGGYARENDRSLRLGAGRWALETRWASGAVLSVDSGRLSAVGGFDSAYFLYYEDVDLCARLAENFPGMDVVLVPTPPGRHAVGGSAGPGARAVERARLDSAVRFARQKSGVAWSITTAVLRLRQFWA